MPKSFEQFILTRFNLEKADWKTNKNSREVLNAEWLENRIKLFKRFCLPSVLGQSNKNFKWLIYFQSHPGDKVRNLIKELEKYTFIKPVFFDGFEDFQQNSAIRLTEILEADTEWILTSRLDNDDALNRFFVENLQNAIDDISENSLLYFPKGLFLDVKEPKKLGALRYPYNQFLSLLERVDPKTGIRTVLDRAHDDWKDFPVKELDDPDAWLQIVHEENMVNTFIGYPVYSKRLRNFDFDKIRFDSFYDFHLFSNGIKRRIKRFLPVFSSEANDDKGKSFDIPEKHIDTLLNNEKAVIVQIGSNDGISGDPLHNLIIKYENWRAIFVEPVPYLFRKLKENYGEQDRFVFENVAINNGELQNFYSISEKARLENPDFPGWVEQLGSFDRDTILSHLNGSLEPYIEEQKITGITLAHLLKRNNIESIDLLHIDVEGYDWIVLSQFDFQEYSPEIILYEHKHLNGKDKAKSVQFLKKNGYFIFQLGSDYMAVKKSSKNRKKVKSLNGLRVR